MLSLTWCHEFNEHDAVLPDEEGTRDQESGRDGGGTGRLDQCCCFLKPVCFISGDCTGMHMASCVIYKSSLALPHAGTPAVKGTPQRTPSNYRVSHWQSVVFACARLRVCVRACVCACVRARARITCMSKLLFPQGIAVSNPISTQYAHNGVGEKQCLHWTSSQRDALLLSSSSIILQLSPLRSRTLKDNVMFSFIEVTPSAAT